MLHPWKHIRGGSGQPDRMTKERCPREKVSARTVSSTLAGQEEERAPNNMREGIRHEKAWDLGRGERRSSLELKVS